MTRPEAAPGVLRREEGKVVANASVVQYNEITPDNIDSFHFHGALGEFPIHAVIAAPLDDKSSTLLQGRYLGEDERAQIVRPADVVDELLGTILTIQSYVITAVIVISLAILATEIGFVLALGILLAALLTLLTATFGSQLIRAIILS